MDLPPERGLRSGATPASGAELAALFRVRSALRPRGGSRFAGCVCGRSPRPCARTRCPRTRLLRVRTVGRGSSVLSLGDLLALRTRRLVSRAEFSPRLSSLDTRSHDERTELRNGSLCFRIFPQAGLWPLCSPGTADATPGVSRILQVQGPGLNNDGDYRPLRQTL